MLFILCGESGYIKYLFIFCLLVVLMCNNNIMDMFLMLKCRQFTIILKFGLHYNARNVFFMYDLSKNVKKYIVGIRNVWAETFLDKHKRLRFSGTQRKTETFTLEIFLVAEKTCKIYPTKTFAQPVLCFYFVLLSLLPLKFVITTKKIIFFLFTQLLQQHWDVRPDRKSLSAFGSFPFHKSVCEPSFSSHARGWIDCRYSALVLNRRLWQT